MNRGGAVILAVLAAVAAPVAIPDLSEILQRKPHAGLEDATVVAAVVLVQLLAQLLFLLKERLGRKIVLWP